MSVADAEVPRGYREVKGPTALGDDPRRLFRLAHTLAATDFKLKFFGSFLGYLWQLMNPLMLFGVLFVVFSFALKLDAGVKYYPVALLLGIVLFSFFSEATTAAVRSLMARESLVRKVDFPRLAVPMASVMTSTFNLALNLVPVLVFLLISGGRPRLAWLGFLVVIAVLVLFAFGMAMILSVAFVKFRDIEPIWNVVLQLLFYSSGVFFTVDTIAGRAHGRLLVDIFFCNPFAALLATARNLLVDPSWQAPTQSLSSGWLLLIPAGIIIASLAFGFLMFRAMAPRVAEDL
ncbi:ABC transporter permease [Baekduia soli]|uniref:ABC transporter permease n=1 Tax=Baekduia soli TaxID=496014 RepID=UPI001652066A|nr:ABC transporter permease [Baekduia soli]